MLLIKFVNDKTGTREIGNYDYTVYVNKEIIAKGRVENHDRKKGWEGLVFDLGEEIISKKNKKREYIYIKQRI